MYLHTKPYPNIKKCILIDFPIDTKIFDYMGEEKSGLERINYDLDEQIEKILNDISDGNKKMQELMQEMSRERRENIQPRVAQKEFIVVKAERDKNGNKLGRNDPSKATNKELSKYYREVYMKRSDDKMQIPINDFLDRDDSFVVINSLREDNYIANGYTIKDLINNLTDYVFTECKKSDIGLHITTKNVNWDKWYTYININRDAISFNTAIKIKNLVENNPDSRHVFYISKPKILNFTSNIKSISIKPNESGDNFIDLFNNDINLVSSTHCGDTDSLKIYNKVYIADIETFSDDKKFDKKSCDSLNCVKRNEICDVKNNKCVNFFGKTKDKLLDRFVSEGGIKTSNITTRDKLGIDVPIKKFYNDLFELMKPNSRNAEELDDDLRHMVYSAAADGDIQRVRLLLDRGAAIDLVDDYGYTALSIASQEGHEAVVRLLLDRGAAIDLVDDYGYTALSIASQEGHEAVVRLLLDRGACDRPHRC